MSHYGYFFKQICDIKRRTLTGEPEPELTYVTGDLKCTQPYPASDEDRERAGAGSFYKLLVVYTAVPIGGENLIKTHDRMLIETENLRVHSVIPWPDLRPKYLKILVDKEAG